MNGKYLIWVFTTFIFIPFFYAESQYECGVHGRFEYCVDGIPGCVIGCHCHPGYYFDTDTKICEPNIRLTQEFRRQYYSEPTRVNIASATSSPENQPVTTNAVDDKIDEITKDADDLGDWLYNQFFKTIENQVINKTQGEELPAPSRRSGKVLLKKPARRSHKYWKGRKKKKLKNKLLRITEDDSLFDSDSGSSNEDESSSSSESDVSESSKKKKSDDHDHKKLLLYNKMPPPPLPSFIFFPNMETPFYPPIGLPPPPAMPMYPMVPVPPMLSGPQMAGPLFSGVQLKCESAVTTDSTSTTKASQELITTPQNIQIQTDATTTAPVINETNDFDTSTIENPPLRQRRKKKIRPMTRSNGNDVPENPIQLQENRNKQIFKKLREKLNRKNKLENFFANQYQEPDSQYQEPNAQFQKPDPQYQQPDTPMARNGPNRDTEFVPNPTFINRPSRIEIPRPEDVNFKYLAELIHRADLNKTLNTQPNITENAHITPVRRNFNPVNYMNDVPVNTVMRQRSRMEDPNDSFYTNLGKQIAAMIRKIDSAGDREVNIEIEGENSKPQSQSSPVFNENNYASRSYWERSVRSPLKFMSSFKKEMDHLKQSNEDLFSIENKVERAVSTVRTLSLHDLERIISTVDKVQQFKPKLSKQIIYPKKSDHSKASFKFNLLPANIMSIQPISKPRSKQSVRNSDPVIIHEVNPRRIQTDDYETFLLSNYRPHSPNLNDTLTKTENEKVLFQNMRPTRTSSNNYNPNEIVHPKHVFPNTTMPFYLASEDRTKLKYQLKPVILHHRSLNHINQNQYQSHSALPIPYTGLTKSLVSYGSIDKPSYFHHEFHHFDYFDK